MGFLTELTANQSCQATEGVSAAMPDGSEVADVLKFCWWCIKGNPDKGLHTPYTRHGRTETYFNMAQECFNLNLTKAGDSCARICEACVLCLLDACEFKQQILHTQAERARLQRTSKAIDEVTAVKTEIADNDEGDDVLRSDVCVEIEATGGAREVDYLSSIEMASVDKCFHARVKEQLRMDCSVRLQRIRTD